MACIAVLQALFSHAKEAKAAMEAALKPEGSQAGDGGGSGPVSSSGAAAAPAAGGPLGATPLHAQPSRSLEEVVKEAAASVRWMDSTAGRLNTMQARLRLDPLVAPGVGIVCSGLQAIAMLIMRDALSSDLSAVIRMLEGGGLRLGGLTAEHQEWLLMALRAAGEREGSQERDTPTPPPAAEAVQLFEVDEKVFSGGVDSSMAYQDPIGRFVPNLRAKPMGTGGYVEDADVKKAYAQVRESTWVMGGWVYCRIPLRCRCY